MKKLLFSFLLFVFNSPIYSQINYEKGSFIDNDGNQTECFIKNNDWKNNPTKFQYKLFENSESKTATLKTIREFEVSETKYIRTIVEMDRSNDVILSSLSTVKKPIFNTEELFLKVLVEGEINLYFFEDGNLKRFFYKIGNVTTIKQLIYKRYKVNSIQIGVNNRYKQQLITHLNCEFITKKEIENCSYKKNSLVPLFLKNNNCGNYKPSISSKKKQKKLFYTSLNIGIQNSSLDIYNDRMTVRNTDFGAKKSLKAGLEFEIVLPINKNKWALLVNPTYQYFKSEKKLTTSDVSVTYTSIELPIGLRHSFFLNNKSKIFMNVLYVFDFPLQSEVIFNPGTDLEFNKSANLTFGLGYSFHHKFSLEFRYGLERDVISRYLSWGSNYSSSSLIMGYTLF